MGRHPWEANWEIADFPAGWAIHRRHRVRLVRSVASGAPGVLKPLARGSARFRPEYRAGLFREAHYCAELSRRGAKAPRVLDTNAGLWRHRAEPLFVVYEYVEGLAPREMLRDEPMAVRDAIVMGIALCETLGAVHREGLLHRDLLPDNVVMRGGRIDDIWLVDFGRAGPADAGPRMRYGKFVEVPGFYDTGCELAQVCAIVHHCLTMARAEGIRAGATPPHRRPGFLLEERARREPGDEAVICAVNLLFDRGLSADRARRFRSAGELGRAFEMALEGRAPPEPGSRIGDERPSRGGFAGSSWAGWTGRFPWPLDATRAPFDMALDAVTAWLADAVGRVAGFPDCAAQ